MIPIVYSGLFLFLGFMIAYVYHQQTSHSSSLKEEMNQFSTQCSIPIVPKEATIIIIHSNHAFVKDAAIFLSQLGYYIIIGVSSEAHQAYFSQHKLQQWNIETFMLQESSMLPIANILYRQKETALRLNRPLHGVVIDVAEILQQLDGQLSLNSGDKDMISSDVIELVYKQSIKYVVKILQVFTPQLLENVVASGDEETVEKEKISDFGRIVLLTNPALNTLDGSSLDSLALAQNMIIDTARHHVMRSLDSALVGSESCPLLFLSCLPVTDEAITSYYTSIPWINVVPEGEGNSDGSQDTVGASKLAKQLVELLLSPQSYSTGSSSCSTSLAWHISDSDHTRRKIPTQASKQQKSSSQKKKPKKKVKEQQSKHSYNPY